MRCHPAGALPADAKTIFGALLLCIAAFARAHAARKPHQGDYSTHGVMVAGGRMIPELVFHYRTLGMPTQDETGLITKAILLLRGAEPGAPDFLAGDSADILFASGQPFDASQYFLIFPEPIDALSEPGELVQMQYRLALEHLGMIHLRLILGNGEAGQLQPANHNQLAAAPGAVRANTVAIFNEDEPTPSRLALLQNDIGRAKNGRYRMFRNDRAGARQARSGWL